jgi:hypothetical protein
MNRILLYALFIVCIPARAHRPEDGKVYAAFGPYEYQTQRFEEQFKSPVFGGWGLIAEGDLNKHGGVELTLIYMNPIFAIEREDKKVIERVKRMYIAMGWRHWFSRDFSVSPSFFSSYVMGDAHIVRNDFVGVASPPHTSARDGVDYGFAISAQVETLRFDNFAVILDGRYSYSVTPKPGEDMNQYGLFVGFKYFIQSKQPDDPSEL